MSCKIYVFRSEIFSEKTESLQYFFHILLLQNCAFLLTKKDGSFEKFIENLEHLAFSHPKSKEYFKADYSISESQSLELILKDMKKKQSPNDFYDFLLDKSEFTVFYKGMEILVQKVLMALFIQIKEIQDPAKRTESPKIGEALDSIITKNITEKNEILVLTWLMFLKKNCKLIRKSKENKCFLVDDSFPTLILYLDKDDRLLFVELEVEENLLIFFEEKTVHLPKDALSELPNSEEGSKTNLDKKNSKRDSLR